MLWMSYMRKGSAIDRAIYDHGKADRPTDPNTKRVLATTQTSALVAGAVSSIYSAKYKPGSFYKPFFASYLAIQGLQSIYQRTGTPIGVGLIATGASAALGFALKDHMGAGMLKGGAFIMSKMKANPATYGKTLKMAESVLERVKGTHPLFKHLATPEGLKFTALLTTLPVAHSLIRRAALKISRMHHAEDSPISTSALHSKAGHTKKHREKTGTSYEKNIKQQASIAVTGSLISHINTGHLIESFR